MKSTPARVARYAFVFALVASLSVLALFPACGGKVFNSDDTGPTSDGVQSDSDGQTGGLCNGTCSSNDCDADGLDNAQEAALGTDPCASDSDGDGIPDKVEVDAPKICVASPESDTPRPIQGCQQDSDCPKGKCVGFDPTNKDQDGDGIVDGEEDRDHNGLIGNCKALCPQGNECGDGQTCNAGKCTPVIDAKCIGGETDPRLADTDGNGTPDKNEGTNLVCNTNALINPTLDTNQGGDWTVALDPAFGTPRQVTITNVQPTEAALVFDDAAAGVAGFVLSKAGLADPIKQDEADEQLMANVAGAAITGVFNRQSFKTYDGFDAVTSQRLVTIAAGTSADVLRDQLLVSVSGHAAGEVSIPQVGSHGQGSRFTLLVTTVARPDRVILLLAVSPQPSFDDVSKPTAIRMRDATNGTALAKKGFGLDAECDKFQVDSLPVADFVWLIDTSGSMSDDQALIASSATEFFTRLKASSIDFRVGVMRAGCNASGVSLNTGKFTTDQNMFSSWITSPTGPTGCENEAPITAGKNLYETVLSTAPPVTQPGDMSMGLRPGAKLIYVFVTDEEERPLQSSDVESRTLTQAQFEAKAAFGPLLSFYKQSGIIPFGMIALAPACTQKAEPSWGAKAIIEKVGGASWPICQTDKTILNAALNAMITAAQGASSTFKLSRVPISSTLKLALQDKIVPRSSEKGFDYDGPNNAIIFNLAPTDPIFPKVGDNVAVSYRFFENAPAIQ
ncbi:MAG: VWA domain-containing protein [Myxococcales bacterium]|nr:VWA domain-containing protein [Myxococcales bacterium]